MLSIFKPAKRYNIPAGRNRSRQEYVIEKGLYFFVFFFFLSLYIPKVSWLYNAAMWLIFVYSFFMNSVREKKILFWYRHEMLLIVIFFLFNGISALLLSDNRIFGIQIWGLRLSLLIFPIALGTIAISQGLKVRLIYAFVMLTTVAALGCILFGIGRSIMRKDSSLLYNDNLSEIIQMQSVYFAQLVNLAFFGFLWLLSKGRKFTKKAAMILIPFVLLTANFLLASRTAIIVLYTVLLIVIVYWIFKNNKRRKGTIVLMATALFVSGMILLFPKTLNRFHEFLYLKYDYRSMAKESHFNVPVKPEQWNGATVRMAIWHNAWLVICQHPLIGTGLGDKMDKLKKQYALTGFQFGLVNNRNTHNSYLDVWLSMGLVGLVLFLFAFFIIPLRRSILQRDMFGIVVICSFFISLSVENYLDRTLGNTLLAFFISFLSAGDDQISVKKMNYPPDNVL